MPGYPNLLSGLGGLYDQGDRINNSQGFLSFDPNAYINPQLIPMLQMQAQQMQFNQQNPRMALPQNFGQAVGNLAQRAIAQYTGNGGQQAPGTPAAGAPNPGGVAQEITARRAFYMQQGKDIGEATYLAASDVAKDPRYADAGSQNVAQRAVEAAKNLGYDRETAVKAGYDDENFQRKSDGTIVNARKGTDRWNQLAGNDDYVKVGDIPQETVGRMYEVKKNGLYYTYRTKADQTMELVGTSSQPKQYINQFSTNNPDDAKNVPGLLSTMSTGAATDKEKGDFATKEANTKMFTDQLGKIADTIRTSNGAAVGKPGDVYEKADNWIQTGKQMAGMVGAEDLVDPANYKFAGLDTILGKTRMAGIDATRYHAQMLSAAYLMTALQNPDGDIRNVSKERVQNNLDQLAEHSSDPQAILQTLDDAKQTAINNTRIKADSLWGHGQGRNHLQFFPYPTPAQSARDKINDPNWRKANPGWEQHYYEMFGQDPPQPTS